MDAQQFGAFIAQQRKEKQMTQKELGNRLSVTDKAISRWENGHGFPDIESIEPLAKELGVSVLELMNSRKNVEEVSAIEANSLIMSTIQVSLDKNRVERKKMLLVFGMSSITLILFAFLKDVSIIYFSGMITAILYSGAAFALWGYSFLKQKKGLVIEGTIFYAVLLSIVPIVILLLFFFSSIQVVHQ